MKTGAQLYTVRAYTQNEKDFSCTIGKIAEMGYKTVQISGIGKDIRPERVREICDGAGLEIVLTHSDVNRILNDTENLIKEHDILGSRYIGLGAMPDKYRTKEWITHFMDDFREPAKKIADAGKLLMYHNHNFEFQKLAPAGTTAQIGRSGLLNICWRASSRKKWALPWIPTGWLRQAAMCASGSRNSPTGFPACI